MPTPAPAASADGARSTTPNPQAGTPADLASELLRSGWVKTKEQKREPTEEDLKKKELENEARTGSKGMWNPQGPKVCPSKISLNRNITMLTLSRTAKSNIACLKTRKLS